MFCRGTIIFFCLFIFLCPNLVGAQGYKQLLAAGINNMDAGCFSEAEADFKRALELKTGQIDVAKYLCKVLLKQNKGAQADKLLNDLLIVEPDDAELLLMRAIASHQQMKFVESISYYRLFLKEADDKDPRRRQVADEMIRCRKALGGYNQTGLYFLVENLGETVNTPFDEVNPLLSPNFNDKLYFSSNSPTTGKTLERCAGAPFDIYSTELEQGIWSQAASLPDSRLNTSFSDRILGFNQDGRIMYYFRGNHDDAGLILTDTFSESGIDAPAGIANLPCSPELGDQHLFFYDDTLLIFSSLRKGGLGGYDLYYSVFTGGSWLEPLNMGNAINTAYDEITPFLCLDGRTLLFSSNSTASIGGFDFFLAEFKDSAQVWLPVVSLGQTINTAGDEIGLRFATDGQMTYFCSNRGGGLGGFDIYSGILPEPFDAEFNTSIPSSFAQIQRMLPEGFSREQGLPSGSKPHVVVENVRLPIIHFTGDADLLSAENILVTEQLTTILQKHTTANVILTGHCEVSGTKLYDAYFTIKRLERVSKQLTDKGIAPGRILLRSCGSEYPAVINNGLSNQEFVKFNRRIQPSLWQSGTVTVKSTNTDLAYPEVLVDPQAMHYESTLSQPIFTVSLVTLPRIMDGIPLNGSENLIIESIANSGQYEYRLGNYESFQEAVVTFEKIKTSEKYPQAKMKVLLNGHVATILELEPYSQAYPQIKAYLAWVKTNKQ
jgi:Tetratricopeptide repeat/WD40-like Beta Propeller Repeat